MLAPKCVILITFVSWLFFFFPSFWNTFYKGGKSKRQTQSEEEQSEQLSARGGEESGRSIERKLIDDILSLEAEVTKLGKIVNKRKRKQKETEKLFKKMIEEWEEMKPKFQDIVNTTKESKYKLAKIIQWYTSPMFLKVLLGSIQTISDQCFE